MYKQHRVHGVSLVLKFSSIRHFRSNYKKLKNIQMLTTKTFAVNVIIFERIKICIYVNWMLTLFTVKFSVMNFASNENFATLLEMCPYIITFFRWIRILFKGLLTDSVF